MSSNFKRQTSNFLLLVLITLGVRVGAAFVWEARVAPGFGFGDSSSYWTLGRAIATGEPYRAGPVDGEIFRTPGYPAILAPLFWIGGNNPPVIWARLLGAVLGTLTVVAVWWLARVLFDARAAWIAGWITALYPGAIATSVFILSEAPFGLLMVINLILWVMVCRKQDEGQTKTALGLALATGVVAGLATLVRPSWFLFLPFAIPVWLVVEVWLNTKARKSERLGSGAMSTTDRSLDMKTMTNPCSQGMSNDLSVVDMAPHRFGKTGLLSVVILLGFVLAMAPWWVRNYRITGHFVATPLQTGASLYDGLNPKADGSSNMEYVDRFVKQERQDPQDAENHTFEERVDRRMHREAVAWIKAHPSQAAHLACVKFLRTWNIWPNEASLSSVPAKIIVCMTYVPILFLALWGGYRTFKRGFSYILCWLPAVYFSMLHVVFVGSIRYRQPAMLALIVLAAGLVSSGVVRRDPRTKHV